MGINIPVFIRRGRSSTIGCGRAPAGSALDVNGRVHDPGDLQAVDLGIGAGDPSLTVIADALRVGHHIVEGLQ